MCAQLPVQQKQQSLDGLLEGCRFYVTERPRTDPSGFQPVHPSLEGLVVTAPSGRQYRTVESAVKDMELKESNGAVNEAIGNFYQRTLGVNVVVDVIEHDLLDKGYHRLWKDVHGDVKELYGLITKCQKNVLYGTLQFTVQVAGDCLSQVKAFGLFPAGLAFNLQVGEAEALGGYVSYLKITGQPSAVQGQTSFHHSYIVPTTLKTHDAPNVSLNGLPVWVLHVKGFRLKLEARQSNIDGLGLWVTCAPLSPMEGSEFLELACGELVDLGVYGPLRKQDCKRNHIALLKNFVHSWACQAWEFDAKPGSKLPADVFDITDDLDGGLHETARTNILVYANETDGHETPSLCAPYDPEGAVHYHLGHLHSDEGPLRIPADGKPFELKIDYGPKYEVVRVRAGYSRLRGRELELRQEQVARDDTEMIRDFEESSVTEISESIEFLDRTFKSYEPYNSKSSKPLARALIVSLVLRKRLGEICRDFEDLDGAASICDNGYSSMGEDDTVNRLNKLISDLCRLFPLGSKQLLGCMLSDNLYREVLVDSLGLESASSLDDMESGELQIRISEPLQY